MGDRSGFPWLSASRVPELVLYTPLGMDEHAEEPSPTHVRTPAGAELELHGSALPSEIGGRFGGEVELMRLKHGMFDDAPVSIISLVTIAGIGDEVGVVLDRRRFRANIVIETLDSRPFLEDGWVGGRLMFGDGGARPAVSVTARDVRCTMINLDPVTAAQDARIMRTVVELNQNNAGVYATVVQTGNIHVGQTVSLETPLLR